jgi:DNA invertase Pin-like site-specific DNA recombinase
MKIGYARVSTGDQNLDLQRDALKAAGCNKIIEDTASGSKSQRSGLDRVREQLRPGDVLVVWRLDRLGRSLRNLIELMTELEGQGVGFQSITEAIDTTTPGGKLVFHIFGALAEFERTSSASGQRPAWMQHGRGVRRAVGGRSSMSGSGRWRSTSTGRRSTPWSRSARRSASRSQLSTPM